MILITGATGLIGSHLALRLAEKGERFRAIYRSDSGIQKTRALFALCGKETLFGQIDWVRADLIDIPKLETAFRGITHVYHCAALISFDPRDEEKLRKTNIEGTANIVNLCLAHGVKKLCHVSSIAGLGDAREGENFVDEESDWNPEKPHSDYAISKHGSEMEVWRAQQEGLHTAIINPGIVIGPPLWSTGSSQLFPLVRKGQRFYTLGTMGFVDVEDVASILILLMESEITGQQFTVSSETLSYREMLNFAADAVKKDRPASEAKPWMTSLAWKFDWLFSTLFGQKRRLSRDDARALHDRTNYPNNKIVNALNWEFRPVADAMKRVATLMKW